MKDFFNGGDFNSIPHVDYIGPCKWSAGPDLGSRIAERANTLLKERGVPIECVKQSPAGWYGSTHGCMEKSHTALLICIEPIEKPDTAEKFADENEGGPGGLYSTEQVKNYEAFAFKSGFARCFALLCELSEREFDKKALSDASLNYYYMHGGTANKREAHGAAGHFEDGAKWMRTFDMAALLKARSEVGGVRESLAIERELHKQTFGHLQDRTDELEAAKQESEANYKAAESWKEQALEKFEIIDELETAKQEIADLQRALGETRRDERGLRQEIATHETLYKLNEMASFKTVKERNALSARVKELEAALGFYSDKSKWHSCIASSGIGSAQDGDHIMMFDDGEDRPWSIAKDALKGSGVTG